MNRHVVKYILAIFLLTPAISQAALLSCNVSSSACAGSQVTVFKMQATTNAQSELNSQSNYTQRVCCGGVTNLGTACSGSFVTVLKLSGTINAHAEQNSQSNYANSVCLSVPSTETISLAYQANNCTGYDTTIASISGVTNAHMGDSSAYATKICATVPESLTFSISDNTIGFGGLSASGARYATGDTLGATSNVADAHTISASTNASNGYTITVNGTTLTSGAFTVTAIGGTATASAPGTKQFGERLIVNSGTGSATSPYASANWALNTAAFPSQVASGSGDGSTTVLGVRYIANVSSATEKGSYSATLTYTVTANF